jgi:hypothetical protein
MAAQHITSWRVHQRALGLLSLWGWLLLASLLLRWDHPSPGASAPPAHYPPIFDAHGKRLPLKPSWLTANVCPDAYDPQ